MTSDAFNALVSIALISSPILLALLVMAVQGTARAARERLRWAQTVREVIRTDSRMLGDAVRLSHAHFQALNELRKLGGRR